PCEPARRSEEARPERRTEEGVGCGTEAQEPLKSPPSPAIWHTKNMLDIADGGGARFQACPWNMSLARPIRVPLETPGEPRASARRVLRARLPGTLRQVKPGAGSHGSDGGCSTTRWRSGPWLTRCG